MVLLAEVIALVVTSSFSSITILLFSLTLSS